MTTISSVRLNNGERMPQIGLGTWPLDDDEVYAAVSTAFSAGYRHVDTAMRYGNEEGVGRAVQDSGLPREEIFVTTKLDGEFQGSDRAVTGLAGSLDRLGMDYVDLLLIHWPLPGRNEYVSTWKTYERLLREGLARSIGVSNFKPAHLERLAAETSVVPAVNQIQLSPFTPRISDREYAAAHGIVVSSYSPLGQGGELLSTRPIRDLSLKHAKTPAQIVLRWHVQNGLLPVPKSADPVRIAANFDISDFELTPAEMAALDALDKGPSAGIDSDVSGH